MHSRIKSILEEDVYFYSLLLVLIAVVSFGLGRMSMIEPSAAQQASVILTKQPVGTTTAVGVDNVSPAKQMQLVGSKNGSKYHAMWCPGAAQIKESNKVFFASPQEAQAKGYIQAANCDI
jgi:hypothetical protein